jgi:AhpD family alkylhydroperoxidase
MQPRIDYAKTAPGVTKAMLGLEEYVHRTGLERGLLELVRLRASLINGCAYCVDMHTKVERLRPRGLTQTKLHVGAWLKEVGPSTELRKWFAHDREEWDMFRRRYARELDSRPEARQPIVSAARRGAVTLVYSSHDEEHNNAVARQETCARKARRPASVARAIAADRRRRSG